MNGMLARRNLGTGILLLVLLPACGTRRADVRSTPGSTVVAVNDTALFAAVVRRAHSRQVDPTALRIDPRPLRADPGISQPTPGALAQVSAEVVALRAAVLQRLQVATTDAIEDARCPGIDIPPPGMKPRHRPGCPESGSYVSLAIGLPRPGGPYWPNATVANGTVKVPDVDQREPGLSLGHWSVRVIHKDVYPTGGPGSVSDYVFKRDPASGQWIFVEQKTFYIVD